MTFKQGMTINNKIYGRFVVLQKELFFIVILFESHI